MTGSARGCPVLREPPVWATCRRITELTESSRAAAEATATDTAQQSYRHACPTEPRIKPCKCWRWELLFDFHKRLYNAAVCMCGPCLIDAGCGTQTLCITGHFVIPSGATVVCVSREKPDSQDCKTLELHMGSGDTGRSQLPPLSSCLPVGLGLWRLGLWSGQQMRIPLSQAGAPFQCQDKGTTACWIGGGHQLRSQSG